MTILAWVFLLMTIHCFIAFILACWALTINSYDCNYKLASLIGITIFI